MGKHNLMIAMLIHKNLQDWTNAVHDGALSAKSQCDKQPLTDDTSTVLIPTWGKCRVYINAGGLANVEVQQSA